VGKLPDNIMTDKIMTDKKVIKGSMLNKVKAAEDSLARQEAKKLEVALPEGHPLKEEVEKQKAILGGDLSGLPPGHPLLRALEAAKETYEKSKTETIVQETESPNVELRKAKKLEDVSVRRNRFAQEARQSEDKYAVARDVNKSVEGVLVAVRGLWEKLASNEEILDRDPMNKAKVMRMRQVLVAVEKRFSETRLSRF